MNQNEQIACIYIDETDNKKQAIQLAEIQNYTMQNRMIITHSYVGKDKHECMLKAIANGEYTNILTYDSKLNQVVDKSIDPILGVIN